MPTIINKKELFELIAESSIYGNLGLFIGAGLPMAILNNGLETIALSWKQLIAKCANDLKIDFETLDVIGCSYPEIASQLCRKFAAKEGIDYPNAVSKLKRQIANNTSWYPDIEIRTRFQHFFETLDPDWVITTNYDTVIEGILTGKGFPLDASQQISSPQGLIPIFHLHGIRTNPDSIIITQEDYISLFRPTQYRQQKLPLILKESVTLMIGYNLGDFNVLTAMDWSKNVYYAQNINYPHDIIQFLYNPEVPRKMPYRDGNGTIILEFSDLAVLLCELAVFIKQFKLGYVKYIKKVERTKKELRKPTNDTAQKFIDDSKYRVTILQLLAGSSNAYISAFLELFFKCVDVFRKRARPARAFHAYAEFLNVLIDIMVHVSIRQMPHALVASLADNLNAIANFIGKSYGQSFESESIWTNRRHEIPGDLLAEFRNIGKIKSYTKLLSIIQNSDNQH